MNHIGLDEYRTVFIAVSLSLILAASFPILDIVIPLYGREESFSVLWILGPTHTAEDDPYNLALGDKGQVFIGVDNHVGHSTYYIIYAKLRTQAETAPNSTTSTPSPLVPLYEFHAIVADGKTWETSLTFSFLEGSRSDATLNLTKISMNDVIFTGDYGSTWDSKNNGFFYQLFFELWIYDESNSSFKYQNRFVYIWLKVTI